MSSSGVNNEFGIKYRMTESHNLQRLTEAIARLATIFIETTAAKVREQTPVAASLKTQYFQKPIDNLMTKKDVSAFLKVSLRTVDTLMRKGYLPYIRLGSRCVRFILADVQNELSRRCIIGR